MSFTYLNAGRKEYQQKSVKVTLLNAQASK